MAEGPPRLEIRRADPVPRPKENPGSPASPLLGELLRGTLAVLFAATLILPKLRILRRKPVWNWLRAAALLLAVVAVSLGGSWGWRMAGAALGCCALALGRTQDPDRERCLQRRHGADYLLNGGFWAGGNVRHGHGGLAVGTPLYLLVRGDQLLLVSRRGDGEARAAIQLRDVSQILIDREEYVPVYVSEAKQPPVREKDVDRHAITQLELKTSPGLSYLFVFRGAFRRHLAETAAYAVFSARKHAVPGCGPSLGVGTLRKSIAANATD